jgi:hypothetical protein
MTTATPSASAVRTFHEFIVSQRHRPRPSGIRMIGHLYDLHTKWQAKIDAGVCTKREYPNAHAPVEGVTELKVYIAACQYVAYAHGYTLDELLTSAQVLWQEYERFGQDRAPAPRPARSGHHGMTS